jgi:hypothetical protein
MTVFRTLPCDNEMGTLANGAVITTPTAGGKGTQMADSVGPLFAAGIAPITKSGYTILFLPDAHNTELQNEGKAPVYYWLPKNVRLARRDGDTGDYAFSMIHFVGVRSEDSHVGVDGTEEVSGGLLAFSTTTAIPGAILQEAQNQIVEMHRGSADRWWGWRNNVTPVFRPAPIVSNTTTVTNLSPNPDGSVPVVNPPAGNPGPAPDGSTPPPGRSLRSSLPPDIESVRRLPERPMPRSVRRNAVRDNKLDPWYCRMQGEGDGSVTPLAENAYSGLMGSMPAALAWASFHGGSGGFCVWQHMKLRVVSPVITLDIVGDWDRIQDHFSAAAHAGGWFWSADIKAAFNNMRQDGTITVNCFVDTTLPNAEKLNEELNKRSDLVYQKFMEQAQKVIFDPPAFNEEPAKASGGFLGLGGGGALKLRRDKTHLHLEYHERREIAYLQDFPISGQLEGLHDEIKADPAAEKKYFTTLYLSDWERKVSRVFVPVVNWPDSARKWVGQPVAMLSVQAGYPNTQGVVQWSGHLFQATDDPANAHWSMAVEMKDAADVVNAPAGWSPDKTFVKRKIHFSEPPSPLENPFVRADVEKNVVDLDPGELGTLTNDINNEVRVDEVGGLTVGPVFLNVDLESSKQIVEVTFRALGKKDDGNERAPVKFSWGYTDQFEPRFWVLFTGQPDFLPKYQYQVRVIVKGSIFTKGMEWTGPWEDASASGPMMVSVPTPEDPGVTTRALPRQTAPEVRPAPDVAPVRPPNAPPARRSLPTAEELDVSGWSVRPVSTRDTAAADGDGQLFESYGPAR